MKMNDWGNRSVPSLLDPNELKNHQVIKEEVRHFVSPGFQRPVYGRNNSLPNIKRGESRWQSSSGGESTGTVTRNNDSPPAFRGVHSPSSMRKQLVTAAPSPASDIKTKKKRVTNHKKGDKITASSAHERTTSDNENGKVVSPRRSKRIRDFQVRSAHESRTRNGLEEEDDDDDDGFAGRNQGSQQMRSFDRVRFSSLFECDSFTGTFPLGGMGAAANDDDDGFRLISTRSLDPLPAQALSVGTFNASSPVTQAKQPRKSAMRKPTQPSSTASSVSSVSMIAQDHADDAPPMMANVALSGATHAAPVSNVPLQPTTKRMDDRWESDLPTETISPPSTSPKVPGRALSDGSVSLATVPLAPSGKIETVSSSNATIQEKSAPAEAGGNGITKELDDSMSNTLNVVEVVEPSSVSCVETVVQNSVGVPLLHEERSDVLASPANASTGSDLVICGFMTLKDDQDVGTTTHKQPRRGSTGVLAQKWEEQFPSKTPILPQSAPTTPKDSARKRFNHRRRGSFGIYANVSNDDDQEPLPPKAPPVITQGNEDDDYDLFLQSGATGDFATWLDQHRKDKEIPTSASPSIHRKSLLPPTQRRGSTGALAQRWEQELLPALQATSTTTTAPLTPTTTLNRRESGSIREKVRQFGSLTHRQSDTSPGVFNGDPRVLDDASQNRRDSKRRGSMAALVEKWEKLITPAGSPKDNATVSDLPLSARVEGCNDIPFDDNKSERGVPSALDLTTEGPVIEKAHSADDPPDLVPCEKPPKVMATKQKRRGSTGALATRSKKEPKEGQIAKTSSGKNRIRGVSVGHVDDKAPVKKKKSHREKATASNGSSKKKTTVETRIGEVSESLLPSREQVAGEGSMEIASNKSPRSSPKASPKLTTKHQSVTKGASDDAKSRKGTNGTTTKAKASKNDMDLSKSSTDSHSSRTALTVSTELDSSKRSTTSRSQSKRTKTGTLTAVATTSTTTTATSTSTSTKVKKRSNSVGAIKVKSKRSNSESSRSRSASRVTSAADSPANKQKKHLPGKLRGVEPEVVTVV